MASRAPGEAWHLDHDGPIRAPHARIRRRSRQPPAASRQPPGWLPGAGSRRL